MQVSLHDNSRSKYGEAERNRWNNVSSAYPKVSTGIPERCTQEAPVRQNEGHRESEGTIAANKERGETDVRCAPNRVQGDSRPHVPDAKNCETYHAGERDHVGASGHPDYEPCRRSVLRAVQNAHDRDGEKLEEECGWQDAQSDESKRLGHKRRKLVFLACIGLRDRRNHRNTDCRWDES